MDEKRGPSAADILGGKVRHVAARHGISADVLRKRVTVLGWTAERAVTEPVNLVAKAARAAGLKPTTVHTRLRRGMSLAEALGDVKPRSNPDSIESKARAVGLRAETVRRRLRRGMSLDQALALPKAFRGDGTAGAAKERGLDPATVRQRRHRGWSLEKALSTPVSTHKNHVTP